MPERFQDLTPADIDHCCLLRDRFHLKKRFSQLASANNPDAAELSEWMAAFDKSAALRDQRLRSVPEIHLNTELPVASKSSLILEAIRDNQVVIIAGETGSGKTTQIPQICLQAGRGVDGMIGHTQPRRIAASTVATRIAGEMGVERGGVVGYQVRFHDQTDTDSTLVKLMTDGILLAEIQRNRFLDQYDTLIIDEAHERSLNIDFLLGYLKHLLPKRPELKLIVTSATIDVERFSRHFGNAPVIEVSGRTYPVDILYQPPEAVTQEDADPVQPVVESVEHCLSLDRGHASLGDILVFLTGEREIRETAQALKKARQYSPLLRDIEILPLYSRLSVREQERVFQPHRGHRVVLATNVAETSLTVPGIRYVVDPGYARTSRYSYKTQVQRLPIEAISRASANQRAGRCGRVQHGVCLRLYSQQDFEQRPAFTEPEILRTNLASVILQMRALGLGEIGDFPFIERPDSRLVRDGYQLLEELNAIDSKGKLTKKGRLISRLQVDPRYAAMLVHAAEHQALAEMLVIVSALSIQDPRERPQDKQQAADQQHRQWQDEKSDFLFYLNLWQAFEEQRQALSQGQLRKWCAKHFLSYLRMREWRDLHFQLKLTCQQAGLKPQAQAAGFEAIHQSLCAGLLSHVAVRQSTESMAPKSKHPSRHAVEYLGARQKKLAIFPGSALYKKAPQWLVAAELLQTSRNFAVTVAAIDPEWLLPLAKNLVKHSWTEPRWDARGGRVVADEHISLYGLPVATRKAVSYGKIKPDEAREIFIREALVNGRYKLKAAFREHNEALLDSLHQLEEKTRRKGMVADEEQIFRFFDQRLPASIVSLVHFQRWLEEAVKRDPRVLFFSRDDVLLVSPDEAAVALFPDSITWGDLQLHLKYEFDPGKTTDGVSVRVPVSLASRLEQRYLDWLVPGLLEEKCLAMLRLLPKSVRKRCVPLPDFVSAALSAMKPFEDTLKSSLMLQLRRQKGIELQASEWDVSGLDDFYHFNIQLLADDGSVICQGRDLETLKLLHAEKMSHAVAQSANRNDGFKPLRLTGWDIPVFRKKLQIEDQGLPVVAWSMLRDRGDHVELAMHHDPLEAEWETRAGLARLCLLSCSREKNYLRKQFSHNEKSRLGLGVIYDRDSLLEEMLWQSFFTAFVEGEALPETGSDFSALLERGKARLVPVSQELDALLAEISTLYVDVRKQLSGLNPALLQHLQQDVQLQLDKLLFSGFVRLVPLRRLAHYPRYLKAVLQRFETLRGNIGRDRQHTAEIQDFQLHLDAFSASAIERLPELANYRWMLEEYRVSVFAQTLGTAQPVSAKRLRQQLKKAVT